MTESRTVRLYNVDPGASQLSFHLNRAIAKTSPRLRRGVSLVAVRITPGTYYDVCATLGVDFEEARRIVHQSHELRAHVNAQRLLVREHPPLQETLAAEAAARKRLEEAAAQIAALNPPASPSAVGAGVDQVAAGLRRAEDSALPIKSALPSIPGVSDATPEIEAQRADSGDDLKPVQAPLLSEPAQSHDAPDVEVAAPLYPEGEPSTDWRLAELHAFAEAHGIVVGNVVSRPKILRMIRKGLANR